jgi:hypothetical protein
MRTFFSLLLVFIGCLFAKSQTNFYDRILRGTIVRISTPTCGSGSGNIIGYDNAFLYIITASHVVNTQDENGQEIPCNGNISVFIPEYQLPNTLGQVDTTLKRIINIAATRAYSDPLKDVAVIKIPINSLSTNSFTEYYLGIKWITFGRTILSPCNEYNVKVDGYASETRMTPSRIVERIISIDYLSRTDYFTMTANSVEEGQSGSFVLNTNDEAIGMLLAKDPGGHASKVIKIEVIKNSLNNNHIPMNLLSPSTLIGTWVFKTAFFTNPPGSYTFNAETSKITFENNGTMHGCANGSFCVENNTIHLFTPDIMSIECKTQGTWSDVYGLFSGNFNTFKMDFRNYYYNFSTTDNGTFSNSGSQVNRTQPLTLRCDAMTITLEKINE